MAVDPVAERRGKQAAEQSSPGDSRCILWWWAERGAGIGDEEQDDERPESVAADAIDWPAAGPIEAEAEREERDFDHQRAGDGIPQPEADLHIAAGSERQVGPMHQRVEEPV